jgi:hypothetical protein
MERAFVRHKDYRRIQKPRKRASEETNLADIFILGIEPLTL